MNHKKEIEPEINEIRTNLENDKLTNTKVVPTESSSPIRSKEKDIKQTGAQNG